MIAHKLVRSSKVFVYSILLLLLGGCSKLIVLDSKGPIGQEETTLIYMSIAAMLIVIVPVFIMTYLFVKRYRGSEHNEYDPSFVHSTKVELVIWLVPIMIVAFLSYLVIIKTHELDPYKAIASDNKPLNIQVISLDWNWLFIYPDHDIAMINELVIPEDVPLSFKLTSATVMTSFFIPQLGSQMYAMAGMQTQLNLMAHETGTFIGHNIEFSGEGYDTMNFQVISKTIDDFDTWVKEAKSQNKPLDLATYNSVSEPGTDYPVTIFSPVEPGLFNHIMDGFMGWMGDHQQHMATDEKNSMKKGD